MAAYKYVPKMHYSRPQGRTIVIETSARRKAKLTDDQAREVFYGNEPYPSLAKRLGVSIPAICNIKRGYSYHHVWLTGDEDRMTEEEINQALGSGNVQVYRLAKHAKAQQREMHELRRLLAERNFYDGKQHRGPRTAIVNSRGAQDRGRDDSSIVGRVETGGDDRSDLQSVRTPQRLRSEQTD